MPQYKCYNKECKKAMDREARYVTHIQIEKHCALHAKNVMYLRDNGYIGALLNIHSRYYKYTSRTHSENAYRVTRKILKDIYTTEQTRLRTEAENNFKDLSERYSIAKTLLEAKSSKIEELTMSLAEATSNNLTLTTENTAQKAVIMVSQEKYKGKISKLKETMAEQRAFENLATSLIGRLYRSMTVKYTYKMTVDDLVPFRMPNGTCVSEDEFDNIHSNLDSVPLDIIRNYTYLMFMNASEDPMVYVKNKREQTMYILKGISSVTPTMITPEFLSSIVAHIIRELREQILKLQARIGRRWDPSMPPEQIELLRLVGRSNEDREKLERDRMLMWKSSTLYTFCSKDFIKDHKSKHTKAEDTETRKVCKATDLITGCVVNALTRLNKDYTLKRNTADNNLIRRFT